MEDSLGERKISVLVGICIAFSVHVIGVYWWYQNDDLLYPLVIPLYIWEVSIFLALPCLCISLFALGVTVACFWLPIPEEEKNLGLQDRLIHVYHFIKETAQNQMVLDF